MANACYRFTVRGSALGLILLLSTASSALAQTPTPTFGPSPTATTFLTPTPTGTAQIPPLSFRVSPNPARSGQIVTLTANNYSSSFTWEQIGAGVRVHLENADQQIAHFTVPALTQPMTITVQLTGFGFNEEPKADIRLLPQSWVTAAVGSAGGAPGSSTSIDVRLDGLGLKVKQVEHDLGFGPYASVADRGGVPDCTVGPGLTATAASFVFTPDGCTTDATCSGVHASLTFQDPIGADVVMYRCTIALIEQAAPPEEGCDHALLCGEGHAMSASGDALTVYCREGSNGHVRVDYADRTPIVELQTDPAAPQVGDDVRLTFSVEGDGGLPSYQLAGAEPYLSGPTAMGGAGPLGDVTFAMHADCPGTARLQLSINYETIAGCPGNTYYRFTDITSPIFPILVTDPDLTPTPTPIATLSPTPLATCAATGTPYCADQCVPCPTIREGCYARACGYCIQCGGPNDELCPCATPTPPVPACRGDCNHDGRVTVDELVRGVDLLLGSQVASEACSALDANADGIVSVDELVAAIAAALEGCTAGHDR